MTASANRIADAAARRALSRSRSATQGSSIERGLATILLLLCVGTHAGLGQESVLNRVRQQQQQIERGLTGYRSRSVELKNDNGEVYDTAKIFYDNGEIRYAETAWGSEDSYSRAKMYFWSGALIASRIDVNRVSNFHSSYRYYFVGDSVLQVTTTESGKDTVSSEDNAGYGEFLQKKARSLVALSTEATPTPIAKLNSPQTRTWLPQAPGMMFFARLGLVGLILVAACLGVWSHLKWRGHELQTLRPRMLAVRGLVFVCGMGVAALLLTYVSVSPPGASSALPTDPLDGAWEVEIPAERLRAGGLDLPVPARRLVVQLIGDKAEVSEVALDGSGREYRYVGTIDRRAAYDWPTVTTEATVSRPVTPRDLRLRVVWNACTADANATIDFGTAEHLVASPSKKLLQARDRANRLGCTSESSMGKASK